MTNDKHDAAAGAAQAMRAAVSYRDQAETAGIPALKRLIAIAQADTGQSRRVADFLLAWYNAADCGGFDLTSMWGCDTQIVEDMVAVFRMVGHINRYPDAVGLDREFKAIWRQWCGE